MSSIAHSKGFSLGEEFGTRCRTPSLTNSNLEYSLWMSNIFLIFFNSPTNGIHLHTSTEVDFVENVLGLQSPLIWDLKDGFGRWPSRYVTNVALLLWGCRAGDRLCIEKCLLWASGTMSAACVDQPWERMMPGTPGWNRRLGGPFLIKDAMP
jgi:hypothetical protein